jgi:hypothetical protein
MDYLRNDYIAERDPKEKERVRNALRTVVEEALALDKTSREFKLMARIALIYVDGAALARELLDSLRYLILPLLTGRQPKVGEFAERTNCAISEWFTRANQLMKDALETRNAALAADSIESVAYIVFLMRVHPSIGGFGDAPEDGLFMKNQLVKSQVMPNVQAGIKLFEQCDNIQGALRMKLLLANFAELIGDKDYAVNMAKEVVKPASEFRINDLVQQAKDHINGQPFYRQIVASALEGREDTDLQSAAQDDEAAKRSAKRTLEAVGLPKSRLANLERDFLSLRDIARERVNHCRHIDLLQEPTRPRIPEDDYRVEPDRKCWCRLHGFRSLVASREWAVLIRAFKDSYCSSCEDRDPKHKIRQQEQAS